MIAKKKKLKKRKITNILISSLLALFILAFIFILVSSNLKLKKRRAKILEEIERTKAEIKELQMKKENYKTQIFQEQSKEFLEKVARQNFNLKKPGEEVAVIVEPEKEQNSSEVQPKKAESPKKTFWRQFLEFFQNF